MKFHKPDSRSSIFLRLSSSQECRSACLIMFIITSTPALSACYVEFHKQCLICLAVSEQNLFQIEYFHFNISDHSFQCEFQSLIHTCVCLKKVNLNKHCNKDMRACSNANKHFKQNLFGTTRGTHLHVNRNEKPFPGTDSIISWATYDPSVAVV